MLYRNFDNVRGIDENEDGGQYKAWPGRISQANLTGVKISTMSATL
jgi:hypothetical protein